MEGDDGGDGRSEAEARLPQESPQEGEVSHRNNLSLMYIPILKQNLLHVA